MKTTKPNASGGFFAFTNWTGIGSFKMVGWQNFEDQLQGPDELGPRC